MTSKDGDSRVLIRHCPEYDREAIRELTAAAMIELGYRPRGRVYVKPNVVFAFRPKLYGGHAYTHPAVVNGSLSAIGNVDGVQRIDVGEKTGIGIPTRFSYSQAGYYKEIRKVRKKCRSKVRIFCIDERRRTSVFIGGRVHDNFRVPRKLALADSKVYMPKLKCHCVSSITGAVKLNIGICSDDERSIRHDFLLDEKIADLLTAGYPDFVIMDAIDVGMGNEVVPSVRRLGLLLFGHNPLAVDLVAARLLGYNLDQVPHLQATVDRGFRPGSLENVELLGDLTSIDALDEHAKRIQPYDDEFHRWQDVDKELARLGTGSRLYHGPYGTGTEKCQTGCVMGLKMFLGFMETFLGTETFSRSKPVIYVIGRVDEEIDAGGLPVFLIGSCAQANILNAGRVKRINRCFTTAVDMNRIIGHRLGVKSPLLAPSFIMGFMWALLKAVGVKTFAGRYFQDMGYFLSRHLIRRV